MTFAMWWAGKYRECGEVPEHLFDMMRDAYERGKVDEREVCAKHFDDGPDTIIYRSEVAVAIRRMRSNA